MKLSGTRTRNYGGTSKTSCKAGLRIFGGIPTEPSLGRKRAINKEKERKESDGYSWARRMVGRR